jgi:hypothetical protein
MYKAEYIFDRGTFGRWSTPMWEGETRAFKLIRTLRKQGFKKIVYSEGPLVPYQRTIIHHRFGYSPDEGKAPKFFKVSF